MQSDKRHFNPRIHYRAGLISLLLLPVLSIWYIRNHTRPQLGYIEMVPAPIGGIFMGQSIPIPREYFDINLTGNDSEDKIKLDYANLKIKDLIKNKDSIGGVHFHFNDNAHYWAFIKVYDICETDSAQCYQTYKNDTWVWVPRTQKPLKYTHFTPPCGGICGGTHPIDYLDPQKIQRELDKKRQEKIAYITGIAKTYWPSELLFVAMTLSALIKFRKSFTN